MRKGALHSVFGLPTILTVLIVLSVLGFASLSLVSAQVENKAVKRSLSLLEGSYEAESLAMESYVKLRDEFALHNDFLPFGKSLTPSIQAFFKAHHEFSLEEDPSVFGFTESSGPYFVTIKVRISPTHTASDFTILSQILKIRNDQDYTQDGDPIWKGPQ